MLRTERQYGFAAGSLASNAPQGFEPESQTNHDEELKANSAVRAILASFTRERAAQTGAFLPDKLPTDDERNVFQFGSLVCTRPRKRVGNYTLYRVSLRDSDAGVNTQTIQSNLQRCDIDHHAVW